MNVYESAWWSVEVPPGWSAHEERECISFFRDDGVGAFQVSAHKHDSGRVPEDDLLDFTKGEFPDNLTLQSVTCGEFVGLGIEYVTDGKFWLQRWLHNGPLLLYVTYNSDAQDSPLEMDDVNQMLATLKPRRAA
jgi:hypothetical protein